MNDSDTRWLVIDDLALKYELPEEIQFNTRECKSYFDRIEDLDILPFSKATIRFSSDKWDFTPYMRVSRRTKNGSISFANVPEEYKRITKSFILLRIIDNTIKIGTVYSHARNLGVVFTYFADKGIYSVEDITANDLNEFFNYLAEDRELDIPTIRNYRTSLRQFYNFYSANVDDIFSDELKDVLTHKDGKVYKAWQETHKSEPIPDAYFDKLLSAIVKEMNDETEPYYYRAIAAIYVLLSQTGLRIGELMEVETDCIEEKTVFTGEKIYYLHYQTWKGQKGNNTSIDGFTYINELSKSAVDVLVNLEEYKKRRQKQNTKFLYCGYNKSPQKPIPIDTDTFKNNALLLLIHLDDKGMLSTINLNQDEYPSLHFYHPHHNRKEPLASARTGEIVKTVAFPTTQQFRFHVCTELYKKGVDIRYIQRFMSHLTQEATIFHVHKKDMIQEDMEATLRVLRGIVSGNEKIIGNDKGLTARIQDFIAENHFNVETDMDAIVAKLAKTIPIRIKTGGVCIKSSTFRECSIDAATNEFYCAYGVCPNIFHFFYHCGVTWRKCKELKEAIDINTERGHKKQVYKDKNNLQRIIKVQLLPELEEFEAQIQKHGADYIYRNYPDLVEIVDNYDNIKQEATAWLQKISQEQN